MSYAYGTHIFTMKHIITIDDRSKIGRNLLELLRILSKSSKAVDFLSSDVETSEALEDLQDAALLKLMEEGSKSGYADTQEVLKKLGIE